MITKNKNGYVEFKFDENTEEEVFLVGDFNNWNPDSTPLKKINGHWSVKLKLKPGSYQFRYKVGTKWANDWYADQYAPNPWGGDNSVVVVALATTMPRTPKKRK